jgi:enoyl-CoA hydratase/carnithine racemase
VSPPLVDLRQDALMSDLIAVDRAGHIATVVSEPPRKAQRADEAMWHALGAAIDSLSADDGLRCVILRGAGRESVLTRQRHPGISRPHAATRRRRSTTAASCTRRPARLAACRHPLVAQIHGICVGGGLEIAALRDLRICGESSRFGAPIKNLGLVDGLSGDGSARAPRRP